MSKYRVKNNGFCSLFQGDQYWRNFDGKSQIAQFNWLRIVSPVALSSILCCSRFFGLVSHLSPSIVSVLKGNPGPLGTYLMTFTSQIYSNILLPTICKIVSNLSAVMDEEKYFFLDQTEILSFCCPLGTLRFRLKGSIGLN